jgi:5-formyltetrahydrofolate cyclo-ligase
VAAATGARDARRADKETLRQRVLAARQATDPSRRRSAAERATRFLLDLPDVMAARCVAAYVSIGTEPSTAELLAALTERDVRLLLPVLREDLDLDWAIYDGPDQGSQGARGLWTPDTPRLGVSGVAEADVVVTPALAVGRDGVRLGRGGGSYDRALARVPAGRLVVTVLYDGEILDEVPAEPHDSRVHAASLPSGVHRFEVPS